MKQLPPVDLAKIATYRWSVWTVAGSWWGQIEDEKAIGGPFTSEGDAHEWVLSQKVRLARTTERTEGRKDVESI